MMIHEKILANLSFCIIPRLITKISSRIKKKEENGIRKNIKLQETLYISGAGYKLLADVENIDDLLVSDSDDDNSTQQPRPPPQVQAQPEPKPQAGPPLVMRIVTGNRLTIITLLKKIN